MKNERLKMLKAMEYLMRNVDDEDVFAVWLTYGVADGDIEYGDLSVTEPEAKRLGSYLEDEAFEELEKLFRRCMAADNDD